MPFKYLFMHKNRNNLTVNKINLFYCKLLLHLYLRSIFQTKLYFVLKEHPICIICTISGTVIVKMCTQFYNH